MKEKKKKKFTFNKNILLVLAVPILMALGVVIGSYISGESLANPNESQAEEIGEEETIVLDEFLLNLEPAGNINRYIKLDLALSTVKDKGLAKIERNINVIRDVIIYEISRESVETIFEDDNKSFAFKNKLKTKINDALDDDLVHEIYISNIVIQ